MCSSILNRHCSVYLFTYRQWDQTAFWILTSMRASCLLYTPSWIFVMLSDMSTPSLCVCNPSNWPLYTVYWPPAPNPQPYTAGTPANYSHSHDYSTQRIRGLCCWYPPLEKFTLHVYLSGERPEIAIYWGATNQPTIKTWQLHLNCY